MFKFDNYPLWPIIGTFIALLVDYDRSSVFVQKVVVSGLCALYAGLLFWLFLNSDQKAKPR